MSDADWGKLVPGKGRPQSAPAGGFGGYAPTNTGGGGAPGGGTAPFAGGLGGFDDASSGGFETSIGDAGTPGTGYGMQGAGDPRMSFLSKASPGPQLGPYDTMLAKHKKARDDWYKAANEARYGPQGTQTMQHAPRGGWTIGPNGELVHGTGRPAGGGGGGYGSGIKSQPYKYMGKWVYPSGPGGRPGKATGNLGGDVIRGGWDDLPGGRLPIRHTPVVRYASQGGPAANPTMMNTTGALRTSRAAQGMTGGGMARGSYHQGIGGYGGPESMQTSMWKPAPTFTPGPFHTTPRQQGLR